MRQTVRDQFRSARWTEVIAVAAMITVFLSIFVCARVYQAEEKAREARESLIRYKAKYPERWAKP